MALQHSPGFESPRLFLSIQPLLPPPEKERRTKTEGEARLDRMEQINVPFDMKPGIQHIGANKPKISYGAGNSQRRMVGVGPTEDQQIGGRNSDQLVSSSFSRGAEKQHPRYRERHRTKEKRDRWPTPNRSKKTNSSGNISSSCLHNVPPNHGDWDSHQPEQ